MVRLFANFLHISLYRNSIYLMLSTGVSALLGFLFWVAVARLYIESDVGIAAALISVVSLLALLSGLGLDYGLIRFLQENRTKSKALLNSVFILSSIIGLVMAAIFIIGIPLWSPALILARQHTPYVIGFIGVVPAVVILIMVKGAFISARRSSFAFLQSSIESILRIILAGILVLFFGTFGIFSSWALAMVIALIIAIFILLPRLYPGYRPSLRFTPSGVKRLAMYSFLNYLTLLSWIAPTYLLPLIVINRLGAEANAFFFISLAMANLVWGIPQAVSLSLFAEGSYNQTLLIPNLKRSLGITSVLLLPAILVVWIMGDKLLLAFGPSYSQEGTQVLRILAIAAIPMAINYLYIGVRRVQKRMTGPVGLTCSVALIIIILSYFLLPSFGINGAGAALIGGHTLGALWVIVQYLVRIRSHGRIAK